MNQNNQQDSRIVIINSTGNEKVMQFASEKVKKPVAKEVTIRHRAIGLNFIDIYHRSGLYPLPLPSKLGLEASGVIEEVGPGVSHLAVGDRVVYASMPLGAYCEVRTMKADQICRLPKDISFDGGASIMLKGLTVEYLFHRTTKIQQGDTILFHAAAGGVGLIACQWARSLGVNLIATAGSDEKCALALKYGATHAINYKNDNFVEVVKSLTNSIGVDVVMDSVGRDTFEGSLDCLKPLGMMISFGNASGKVPPFDIGRLQAKGSLKITRPTLFNPHLLSRKNCKEMAEHLFKKIQNKEIQINIGEKYLFEEIADAHKSMELRKTIGSSIITL